MNYIKAFQANTELIQQFDEDKAYLVWSMALYLDCPDAEQLATECLTDDGNDKKIDFIRLDWDSKRIVFAQGYYSSRKGHEYSLKRGFSSSSIQLGIEQVIQPMLAFAGDYISASRGKNSLFERRSSYEKAFKDQKSRHILLVHTLSKAINAYKIELSKKRINNQLVSIEKKQIALFINLTFKSFLIAIIGKCLESIIGEKVDSLQVAFTPEASRITNKSINDLIALWLPIVTTVLAYVANIGLISDF